MMQLILTFRMLAIAVAGAGVSITVALAQTDATSSHLAALKAQYRRAPAQPIGNPVLVDLGRDLFFDPALSASGKTACGTCHLPQAAWSVTDARSINDSGKPTSRKSQTLIGIGHADATPVGWD